MRETWEHGAIAMPNLAWTHISICQSLSIEPCLGDPPFVILVS
jgi:hypothetical protein